MNKIILFLFVAFVLTGCDSAGNKWGAQPQPTPPPANYNFSLFGGGSGGGNSTEERIQQLERKLEEKDREIRSLNRSPETVKVGEVSFENAPRPKVVKEVEKTVDHWVTVNLPSRERPRMTKPARVKIQIPARRMTLDERNLAIAEAVDEMEQSGLHAEDLVALPAGMSPGRR